jgi:hypothetical protein
MGARRDTRSHPSAPLYYPGSAAVQNAEQLGGSLQLSFSQLLGQIADTQVPESAVTQHAGAINLDNLGDVNAPTPSDGDALTWDNTAGEWVNTPLGGGGPHALDSHTDVNASTPADGDVLTWDATPGEWVAAPPATPSVALDDITDVNAPTPADGEVLTWDNTAGEWVAAAAPGSSPARDDEVITTGSLADGAEETGTVALGKSGFILKVTADRACWVRFYGTSAERTADAGRLITEDPDDDVPVLADLIFSASLLTIPTAPLIGYTNRDGSPATSIYYSIINKSGATSTVQVTITRLNLEP